MKVNNRIFVSINKISPAWTSPIYNRGNRSYTLSFDFYSFKSNTLRCNSKFAGITHFISLDTKTERSIHYASMIIIPNTVGITESNDTNSFNQYNYRVSTLSTLHHTMNSLEDYFRLLIKWEDLELQLELEYLHHLREAMIKHRIDLYIGSNTFFQFLCKKIGNQLGILQWKTHMDPTQFVLMQRRFFNKCFFTSTPLIKPPLKPRERP